MMPASRYDVMAAAPDTAAVIDRGRAVLRRARDHALAARLEVTDDLDDADTAGDAATVARLTEELVRALPAANEGEQ